MRNIDKGMLLAEYFDADSRDGVESFKKWVKSTNAYSLYLKERIEIKKTNNIKAKKLVEYVEGIDLDLCRTMEEAVICYGEILHFIKVADVDFYTNPFLIEKEKADFINLGKIKLEFDGKITSINELSTKTGYTFNAKDDALKSKMKEWNEEINQYIVTPVKKLQNETFYISERRIFNFSRTSQLIVLLMILGFQVFCFVTRNEIFSKIGKDGYGKGLGFVFHLLLSFTIVYIVEIIVLLIKKAVQYKKYIKNRKKICIDIDKYVVEQEKSMLMYIEGQMVDNSPVDVLVSKFNGLVGLYEPIVYFEKRLDQKKIIKYDNFSIVEKISMGIYLVTLLTFIVYFLIKLNGGN